MPIYEYICTQCEHQLEALQKMSDEPLVYCPECGKKSLRKQVSVAAFRLKGTGWYETDFKHGNSGKPDNSKIAEKANNTSTGKQENKTSANSAIKGKAKKEGGSDKKTTHAA